MVLEVVAAQLVMLVMLALVMALVLVEVVTASWKMTTSLEIILEQWCQELVARMTGSWLLEVPGCAVWQGG